MAKQCKDPVENIEDILDCIETSADSGNSTSLGQMLDTIGQRSFGPILLLLGLIALSPLSGIPGMPTFIGTLVVLVAAQLLFGRKHFWLPQWVHRRKVSREKLERALRMVRKPARWVDRILRPRLTFLTRGPGVYLIARVSILVAATMPPLEILPFVATTTGAILSALGLALIARDGLIALIALVLCIGGGGFLVHHFFF